MFLGPRATGGRHARGRRATGRRHRWPAGRRGATAILGAGAAGRRNPGRGRPARRRHRRPAGRRGATAILGPRDMTPRRRGTRRRPARGSRATGGRHRRPSRRRGPPTVLRRKVPHQEAANQKKKGQCVLEKCSDHDSTFLGEALRRRTPGPFSISKAVPRGAAGSTGHTKHHKHLNISILHALTRESPWAPQTVACLIPGTISWAVSPLEDTAPATTRARAPRS